MDQTSSLKTPREYAVQSMRQHYLAGGIALAFFWVACLGIALAGNPAAIWLALAASVVIPVRLALQTVQREGVVRRRFQDESFLPRAARPFGQRMMQDDDVTRPPDFAPATSASDLFRHTGPAVNVDGTPMVGDSGVDIHGNPFGVTSDAFSHDAFSSSGGSSSWSDSSSGGGGFGGMGGF